MRAIVLVCLLHAALAWEDVQWDEVQWDPLSEGTQDPQPNAGNECTIEQGSCSCCLMLQEVNRLRTYFNTTLNMLEKEYDQTLQSLNKIEASYTAVSASLFNEFKCYGEFSVDTIIKYEHIFTNLGNDYNVTTGIFTVPRSGVYSISFTVYSDSGAPGISLVTCAALLVNGQVLVGSTENNMLDQEDSGTVVVALQLEPGDQVAVILHAGCVLCDDSNHYNTFSAFLLYCTE